MVESGQVRMRKGQVFGHSLTTLVIFLQLFLVFDITSKKNIKKKWETLAYHLGLQWRRSSEGVYFLLLNT